MTRDSEFDEQKRRFQDANAREQQLLIALKMAGEADTKPHGTESSQTGAEGQRHRHRHHHNWNDLSWRGKIVLFLHRKQVHNFISGLIVLDALLVMATLQIQMEVFALESLSKTHCLQLFFVNSSAIDPRCVVDHPQHLVATQLEFAEHILGYTSIAILGVFLVENTLLLIAFGRNFAKVFFYPLDLCVVILSIASEVLSFTISDDPRLEAAEEVLEPSTLKNRGSIAMDVGGAFHVVGVIIFARFWRFFRVGHAVYFIETEEESEKRLEIAEEASEKQKPTPETTQSSI